MTELQKQVGNKILPHLKVYLDSDYEYICSASWAFRKMWQREDWETDVIIELASLFLEEKNMRTKLGGYMRLFKTKNPRKVRVSFITWLDAKLNQSIV